MRDPEDDDTEFDRGFEIVERLVAEAMEPYAKLVEPHVFEAMKEVLESLVVGHPDSWRLIEVIMKRAPADRSGAVARGSASEREDAKGAAVNPGKRGRRAR
jgi:hypothetical protein